MMHNIENALIIGNALEILPQIFSESIDLIITDPPYESLRRFEGIGTTGRMGLGKKGSQADDPDKFYPTIKNDSIQEILNQFYRILKPNTHCYIMCDYITLPYLYKSKFNYMKPLIWNKIHKGMGYHYRSSYEFVVMFEKGKRKLNDLSVSDVISIPKIHHSHTLVPTQKPDELYELIINQSSKENEIILDAFAGSRTIVRACKKLNRKFIAIELQEKNCKIIQEEINGHKTT